MRFGWDETKRRQNLKSHGVDFRAAYHFEWDVADITIDDREDYGELREVATSFIGAVPYVLTFTERYDDAGAYIWVISLRKANRKERKEYERAKKD
jgi:uncharacterized DUF497 family protein